MAISKGYSQNFNTLVEASQDKHVCLLECTDKVTGQPVMVVCAWNKVGEEIEMVPFAKLFDGNPYDEVDPPSPNVEAS